MPRTRPELAIWGAAFVAGLVVVSCRGSRKETGAPHGELELTRGEIVVVERAAAEFFQGRVLSVAGATVKVQTTEDGEPVVVARGDVYRVAPGQAAAVAAGPAICNDAPDGWHACLVLRDEGAEVVVRTRGVAELRLGRTRVLAPSAVTALDVRRAFERLDVERSFAASASSAGEPRQPAGWTPEPHEPVIARRGGEWYSAHADGLAGDGGIRVRWEGDDRPVTVAGAGVVPVPPFVHPFAAGQFVLSPPSTGGAPWRRVRVEAASADEAVVVDDQGQKLRISVRELVPLGGAPGR